MKKWIIGAVLVMGVAASQAGVVISDDFTVGNNDNVNSAEVAGTVTDVGNVIWRANASGKYRFTNLVGGGGGVINQNNLVGSDPRLYLDYAPIMGVGNVTTLSLKAMVVDATEMNFGFGSDDNVMSGSASAFWARINSNGTVDMWVRSGGSTTKIFNGVNVKATGDDILDISLTYDQANNQVWGFVAGGNATATLTTTTLGFTPTFDQFNFELKDEVGARAFAGYFDDVQVNVIPEPATLGLVGLSGVAVMLIRRYFVM